MNKNDVIKVAEALYKEKNPNSKMDTPSFAYETVEKKMEKMNGWLVNLHYHYTIGLNLIKI